MLENTENNLIKQNPERCRQIFMAMAHELRSWDIKNAFGGGLTSAVVYISFLKFLSDRREKMGIQGSDLFQFDALCEVYPKVVQQEQILRYLGDVEHQIGFAEGLIGSLLFPKQGKEFDAKFLSALWVAKELDFTTQELTKAHVRALIDVISKLAAEDWKSSGIFYTPVRLSRFLAGILDIQDGMSVYDPCAGIGIALTAAMWEKKVNVFAQEINVASAAVLEMLLIMSGMSGGRVQCDDSIWSPLTMGINARFDRVICDPPYMKPESGYLNSINSLLREHILYYPEERIEDTWIFVRHIIAAMKTGGRAAVILPMSMLTREGYAGRTRQRLIEDGYIESVIELPSGVYPSTNVKMSILVLQKAKAAKSIFFLDLSRGLWEDNTVNDSKLAELVLNREERENISRMVSIAEIIDNGGQLAVARYIKQSIDMERFIADSQKLYEDAERFERKYTMLCSEFKEALDEYNYYCNKRAGAYDDE